MAAPRLMRLLVALTIAASLTVLPACSETESSAPASSSAGASSSSAAVQVVNTTNTSNSGDTDGENISVIVNIAAPKESGGFNPIDTTVSVPKGASVLDVLEAVATEVIINDGHYGAFVTSINGLANGSAGAQSGWTYSVNSGYVASSAADCILANGDTVAWEFRE